MTIDDLEGDIRDIASGWALIRAVSTEDKADHAIKMRLHIMSGCFVQVYANIQKQLSSYTLVLNRTRVYGRDSEGGQWHRHPRGAADTHDIGPEGARAVSLAQFLAEAQEILQSEGIL